MCLLSKRDKSVLDAMLWRAKTNMARDKKGTFKALQMTFIFMAMVVVFKLIQKPADLNVQAQDNIVVTSSGDLTNSGGQNFFANSNISTNFSLPNCTLSGVGAQTIAFILPSQQSEFASQEQAVIDGINTVMLQAYSSNNPTSPTMSLQSYNSISDLNSYVKSTEYEDNMICFAYGFSNFNLGTTEFDLSLFFYQEWIPATRLNQTAYQAALYAVSPVGTPKENIPPHNMFQQYNYTGFQQLMTTATQQVMLSVMNWTNSPIVTPQFTVAYLPMNTGSFLFDPAQALLIMCMGMLAISIQSGTGRIIGQIVAEEHELKLKQMLRQSGMTVATEVFYRAVLFSILCAILIPIITLFVVLVALTNVSFGVIFLFLLEFAVEIFPLTIILTYGFGKYAVLANIVYTLISVLISVFTALNPSVTPTQVAITSIFPNMQLQNFAKLAFLAKNDGAPTINITQLNVGIYGIKPIEIIVIGLIDLVFFLLLLTYLWPLYFKVNPEKNLRFYYPFTHSYWCDDEDDDQNQVADDPELNFSNLNNSVSSSSPLLDRTGKLLQEQERAYVEKGMMEVLKGNESHETLKITNLVKNYGKKAAVNNLTLTLFKDQILVLLGHNGAGKTTTISMLTGEIKATSGQATAFGYNLLGEGDMADVISFCPQSNILLEKMTVYENLLFFCKFRSVERPEVAVTQTLEDFHMTHKQHAFASQLSGGQKRKLQLMIALIGNARIVLLDEPTSGMDPNSRRETWNILKRMKQDKIIILTTHYMDEAEVLGDRVAIVSHGELQCCGSSLFLKNKYSNGFFIQITKINQSNDANLDQFEQILQNYLQKTEKADFNLTKAIDESGRTVYTVPKSLGEFFEILFKNVDANMSELNIAEYSIRSSSLEEVFIDIGEREKQGELPAESQTSRFSRTSSHSSMREQRTELGDKTAGRTFCTFISLNCKTSLVKIIVGTFFALMFTSIGAAVSVLSSKLSSPGIQLGNPSSVYSIQQLDLTTVNVETITGASTQSFFSPLTNFQLQPVSIGSSSDTSTPFAVLSSWAQAISSAFPASFGSMYVYNLPVVAGDQMNVAVYGNLQSLSSQNVYGNLMLGLIGQYYLGNKSNFTISFTNQPLVVNAVLASQTSSSTTTTLGTMICTTFLILTILTARLVTNRFDNGFYNLLMTKSGEKKMYFASLYIVDVLVHLWVISLVVLIMYSFGLRIPKLLVAAFLFAFANPMFIYAYVSYTGLILRRPGVQIVGSLTAILMAYMLVLNLTGAMWYNQQDYNKAKLISSIFAFLPLANFISSITSIQLYKSNSIFNGVPPLEQAPLGQYGAQTFIRAQVAIIFVYLVIFVLVLFGYGHKKALNLNLSPTPVQKEDKCVQKERERVKNENWNNRDGDIVKGLELVKQYEKPDPNPQTEEVDRPSFLPQEAEVMKNPKAGTLAVKGVSFGVKAGEVFALLGVSGAGKSSTFNMILGEENLSGGKCQLNGVSVDQIFHKPEDLVGIVGYCPQTNCIEDFLTVKTTLTYLANLLGVKTPTVETIVRETMARFGLTEFSNTLSAALSGGNKRKLCCAMAMLGNPKVMFIDEASAGVDPISRRIMWKGMRFESINSALILTTHTLEEAEALASKIGIMVSGHLKCFGSLQQIQAEFGNGFEIEINLDLADLDERLEQVDTDKRLSADVSQIKERLNVYQEVLKDLSILVMFNFAEEFSMLGLLGAFFTKVAKGEQIDMVQLQKEVQVQNAVAHIVAEVSEKVSAAQVISFDGSYLQLRLAKQAVLSYGKVYGLLEQMQQRLPIREYSCKQASLEQIFVSFAKNDSLRVFNQRLTLSRRASLQN